MAKNHDYGNEAISALKGADRVRLRPSVIFGSDGLEGCEHAVFEIMSNAIDEARAGYGSEIWVTRFADGSFQVEDSGRGCPVDWNEKEQRSANCTPAANMAAMAAVMNMPWASTAWAPAPPSIPASTWM